MLLQMCKSEMFWLQTFMTANFLCPNFLCHILECSNGHSSFWNWAKGSRVRDVFSLGFLGPMYMIQASQVAPVVKNLPAMQEILRDAGSIPGWRRSPEGGHGNPLQYSCLENPMDGGAWWTTVYRVAKREDWSDLAHIHEWIWLTVTYS